MAMRGFRERGDVGDDDRRVRDGLDVKDRRPGPAKGGIDRDRIGWVDEFGRDAEPGQDSDQQVSRGPVHGSRGNDRLPGVDRRHERGMDGGHAAGEG